MAIKLQLHHFVAPALGQHRHNLPADQFKTLVLGDDASLHHRLDLGHGPRTARQPVRRLCRARSPCAGKSYVLIHDLNHSIKPSKPGRDFDGFD
jgi:hypothetical protein